MGRDPASGAAEAAGDGRELELLEAGPRARSAGALGEPVHDRVAAVRENDVQRARAVAGGAPEGLDLVEGRAVPDDGHDRTPGQRHAQAGRRREREAESALRGAQVAERLPRRQAVVDLGPVDRGLLDTIASRGSRSASAASTCDASSGSPGAGGSGAGGGGNGSGGGVSRCSTRAARPAQTAAGGASTASCTGLRWISSGSSETSASRVPGSVNVPGAYAAWRKAGAPTTRTASWGPSCSRSRSRSAERTPAKRRWSCGKPARAPNASWKTGATSRSASSTSAVQVAGSSAPGADHERGRRGVREERGERLDRLAIDGRRPQHRPERRGRLALLVRGLGPVVHRDDHERRAAGERCSVVGALERGRDVLRACGLLDAHRVGAGEPLEAAGEERLVGEVTPVLLADDDDERRAVDTGGRERADRVAEPRGRVQEDERRLAAPDRVAARHADHGSLVQAEHEVEIVGQPRQERHLGRAGVREERRQPAAAEDVERRVADEADGCRRARRHYAPQTSSATSTTSRSFAAWSSAESALPSTVDEKPHCGERQSWSRST